MAFKTALSCRNINKQTEIAPHIPIFRFDASLNEFPLLRGAIIGIVKLVK